MDPVGRFLLEFNNFGQSAIPCLLLTKVYRRFITWLCHGVAFLLTGQVHLASGEGNGRRVLPGERSQPGARR